MRSLPFAAPSILLLLCQGCGETSPREGQPEPPVEAADEPAAEAAPQGAAYAAAPRGGSDAGGEGGPRRAHPDLTTLIGTPREEVERRLGSASSEAGIWVGYGSGLALAYNRGVAVRVRVDLPEEPSSCTEAGRLLGFTGAEPSRAGEGGVHHCVLVRHPSGSYRGSVVARLEGRRVLIRPVPSGRCGNELLR